MISETADIRYYSGEEEDDRILKYPEMEEQEDTALVTLGFYDKNDDVVRSLKYLTGFCLAYKFRELLTLGRRMATSQFSIARLEITN